jgi:hypothetical protein
MIHEPIQRNYKNKSVYDYSYNQSDVLESYVVVLTGNGALYQSADEMEANIEYAWFNFTQYNQSLHSEIDELNNHTNNFCFNSNSNSTVKDSNYYITQNRIASACTTLMLVSFIAKRDIESNEELTVHLKRNNIDSRIRYTSYDFAYPCL